MELRRFQSLISEFQRLNAQVLGSSTDPIDTQIAFARHCGLDFPLLADSQDYSAAKLFGVYNQSYQSNERVTFVIDRSGTVRRVIADEGDLHRHADESLEVLKEL